MAGAEESVIQGSHLIGPSFLKTGAITLCPTPAPGIRRTAYRTYLFRGIGRRVYVVLVWRGRATMAFDGGNPVADRATNVPAHLPSLIGREEAIGLVRDRLLEAERGLLTLTGTGGSGKTRLALAIAHELLDSREFPDGVWLAELAPVGDALLVPGAIAVGVGVKEQPGRPIRDTLLEELRFRTLLVVLDNCEHQVEACAALADDVLRTCPGVRILATSREPLRIHGERVWRVPPLPTPEADVMVAMGELLKNPAVRLFVERAQAAQSSFTLTLDNSQAVAAICVRLDGLPLAIELAAARVRVLTPHQILARLDDAFRLLIGGSRTAPTRQQTLRATLDWSYRLLDQATQRRFESLAVFAAGFDLEAAEAIWSSDSGVAADALDMLTALVDRSLVTAQPLAGAMRYRLLEPVRQYAEARLVDRGAWEPTRCRHAEYFLGLVEAGEEGLKGADHEAWRARLELEHDNVRAVLRRCLDAGDATTAGRIGSALKNFWRQFGHRNEGRRWLEDALDRGSDMLPTVRAKAVQTAAEFAHSHGDYRGSKVRFERAVANWRALGDRAGLGSSLGYYGRTVVLTAHTADEYGRGKALIEEAIAVSQQAGTLWWVAWNMQFLGASAWEHAELELAVRTLNEGKVILTQLGESHAHSHLIATLGAVLRDQGDLDRGQQLIAQSLAESRAINCQDGEAVALSLLAGLTRLRGDAVLATKQAVEGLVLQHRQTNDALGARLAGCVELLGGLACVQGHSERTARLFGAAATVRHNSGVPMPPILRAAYERDLAMARHQLGPRHFDAAWADGAQMNVEKVVEYASEPVNDVPLPRAALSDLLSQREREVVALLARGYTNRQIADELVISSRTADGHVAHILAKLGLSTRAQAAVWAVEHQLVSARS
jgi:predicted ATPase/DNA-binding CsgD family transcriptional regulator